MARSIAAVAAALAALVLAAPACAGHGLTRLDHSVPFNEGPPAPMSANSGGEGAEWEFLSSFATGNPHTDLDFFTQGNKTLASVGIEATLKGNATLNTDVPAASGPTRSSSSTPRTPRDAVTTRAPSGWSRLPREDWRSST